MRDSTFPFLKNFVSILDVVGALHACSSISQSQTTAFDLENVQLNLQDNDQNLRNVAILRYKIDFFLLRGTAPSQTRPPPHLLWRFSSRCQYLFFVILGFEVLSTDAVKTNNAVQ